MSDPNSSNVKGQDKYYVELCTFCFTFAFYVVCVEVCDNIPSTMMEMFNQEY